MDATRFIVAAYKKAVPVALLFLSLWVGLLPGVSVAQTPATKLVQGAASLSGNVVDVVGKPVGGAEVFAESPDATKSFRVTADASGAFLFRPLEPGSYTIHAAKEGSESLRSTLVVTKGPRPDVRIVLDPARTAPNTSAATSAGAGETMDFVDKPTFTVAGVTDWTAVGGHGSDATLRTSEELNREALALRTKEPAVPGSVARDTEARLRTAVSGSPQDYEANRDLGLYYLGKSQFTQAVSPLQAAVRINHGAADDEYQLALALQGEGNFAEAQRHVRQALAQKDGGDFRRLAGELEEQLGNPLAAVQEEQRATRLDPSEVNYFTWGSELLQHRAIWQAAEVFANGAKAYPASVRLKTAWGAALFAGGLYNEAAVKICEASDLDPAARGPYLFAGRIALASPSTAGCVPQKLERFLALRPDDADANYYFATFLLRQGAATDQERAQELLRKAVTLDPQCSDAYVQLGIMAAARKDYTGAIAAYKKALDADPKKGEAHYRLAIAYERAGDAAKAKVEYQLHEQIDARNAALIEQERRQVKQFSIVTSGLSQSAPAP